jgi:NAD(P)H dehydrogenase (quinone)
VQHLSHGAQDYRDGIFSGMNNLVEVISGSKPMTIEEHAISTRSKFDTDGRYAVEDVLLPTA